MTDDFEQKYCFKVQVPTETIGRQKHSDIIASLTSLCIPHDMMKNTYSMPLCKQQGSLVIMCRIFFSLFTLRNICRGYLLDSPRRGDSNKYPQHKFLGVLNTVFLNISNYLSHLELRNRSIQIVVISNVGIKRFDCISRI